VLETIAARAAASQLPGAQEYSHLAKNLSPFSRPMRLRQ
jgi:hypothetical protein